MNGDSIFLRAGEDLVVMAETPYAKEAILQQALAEHPEVIAGPTTAGDESDRLLLVRRDGSAGNRGRFKPVVVGSFVH